MGAAEAMRLMARQNVGQDISSAPQTFSSWDNCMQKAYCKWPAIVGIVIGSLILLTIIGCLVSCLCCGVQCCKGCCECCSCCCPSGGGGSSRPKYSNQPAPYYQQPPPPGNMQYPPQASAPPAYRGPQTATFDQGQRKVNGDSLPAMPTWADASTRRVEDHEHPEEVEMDRFDDPEHEAKQPLQPQDGIAVLAGPGQRRSGYQELPAHSPHSPQPPLSPQPAYHDGYGAHEGPQHQDSYFPAGEDTLPAHPDPNSGNVPPAYGMAPSPLLAAGAASAPYRRYENAQPRRAPNFNSPRAYDRGPSPNTPPAMGPPPQRSPYPGQAPSPYNTRPPPQQQMQRPPPQQQMPRPHPPALQTQQPPAQAYNAYSPPVPSSPPPPFSAGGYNNHSGELNDSDLPANLQSGNGNRPPSLLQAGPRKPLANSWRNV